MIKGDFGASSPSLSLCPSMNAVVFMAVVQRFSLNECKKSFILVASGLYSNDTRIQKNIKNKNNNNHFILSSIAAFVCIDVCVETPNPLITSLTKVFN